MLKSEYGSSLKEEISYYFFYIEKKKWQLLYKVTSFNLKRLHSWCCRPQKRCVLLLLLLSLLLLLLLYCLILLFILLYLYSLKSI